MKKASVYDCGAPREGELELIGKHTRRPMSEDEVYTFTVTLCDNDIDRDGERFSDSALLKMAELFDGVTGICDHSPKADNQRARIFRCFTEQPEGELTSDGRPYIRLCARAYMPKIERNAAFIAELDAGIKKEVSVGLSTARRTCSVCGTDRKEGCAHRPGKRYGGGVCHTVLEDPCDAYEWSFVAVPAQKKAGVTKTFEAKEKKSMSISDIIKSFSAGEVTLTESEAAAVGSYIEELEAMSNIGKNFLEQKRATVARHITEIYKDIGDGLVKSAVDRMSTLELDAFYGAISAKATGEVQLCAGHKADNNNSGFII